MMMKHIRAFIVLICVVFISGNVFGQEPPAHGWTINESDYEYDCEVYSIIMRGVEEISTGTLGAFSGSTCRGFGEGIFLPSEDGGHTIFTVRCWSNTPSGEILSFIWFDPSDESYHNITETVTFVANTQQGNPLDPLLFNICNPVSIITQPTSSTMCASSGSESFTVAVSGTSPYTYQWQYYNGSAWANVSGGSPSGAVYTNSDGPSMGVSGISVAGDYDYRCYVTNCNGNSFDYSDEVTLTVNATPLTLSLTGDVICESPGGDGTIISNTSQVNVSYQLYNSSNGPVQTPKTGTGSGLTWTGLDAGTGYYVIGTNTSTNCVSSPTTPVSITTNPNPIALILTGSDVCEDPGGNGTIRSTTSQSGVSYQLYDSGNQPVQGAKTGTGSALTWTALSAGSDYYVIGTNSTTECKSPQSNRVDIEEIPNPAPLVLTGGSICEFPGDDGKITSSTSVLGVDYQLYNSGNQPVQGEKSGTGSGLTWTDLPAGTGYYVVAEGQGDCISVSNTVDISTIPNPQPLVINGSSICETPGGNGTITSTTSVSGVRYQLYDSDDNPIQGQKPGTGSAIIWTSLPAGEDYYVVSENGGGCTARSNTADVTEIANPVPLVISGDEICASPGGNGEIESTTSQIGVKYQLYNNQNVAVQDPQDGTGGKLVWSSLPAGNNYYVTGTTDNGGCTSVSNHANIEIIANPDPLVLSGSVICASPGNDGTIKSITSEVGIIYQLFNSLGNPVQGEQGGTGLGITWSSLPAGSGYYVISRNSTGCIARSNDAEISTWPNPSISTPGIVTSVCYSETAQTTTMQYSSATGSPVSYSINWDATANNAGLADQGTTLFAFNASGGVITNILVSPGAKAGDPYRGTMTITTNHGCTSTLEVRLTINALPVLSPITGDFSVCAGSTTTLSSSPSGGEWTSGSVSIATVNSSTGVVTGVSAGTALITYTYSDGSCANSVSQTVNVLALPSAPVIGAVTQPTCEVATGSVVLSGLPAAGWTINGSPGDIVRNGSGTSATVSGLAPGTYRFTVTNLSGCTSGQSGSVVINSQPPSPQPPVHSVDCSQGFGNAVVTVSSPVGSGYSYRLDNGAFQTSPRFENVENGTHTITVRNTAGCTTTGPSFSVSCGCANPPTVTLSATEGNTCGTSPVTVSGNTFGGSSTSVTLTDDGGGSLSPPSSTNSPFSFTYTPSSSDAGKTITITATTNNPDGYPCTEAVATYSLKVNVVPSPPVVGTRTHPTCAVPTGSVRLSGLPSSGSWILRRNDGVEVTGEGTSITIYGLNPGTYTFRVTNAEGCTSAASSNVVINPQPATPTAPVPGTVTQPTCTVSTGTVGLSGLPSSGTWTLIRIRSTGETVTVPGTGVTYTVTGVLPGTYTFTVTNSEGCTSPPSSEVVIFEQPPTPSAPVIDSIAQPTCTVATGTIYLSGLPENGTWTLRRFPDQIIKTGTGTTTSVSGLTPRTYYFTVTNEAGCTSVISLNAVVNTQPPTPPAPTVGTITHPTFSVPTGRVQLRNLPSSGAWIITRLPQGVKISGTGTIYTVTGLQPGTYTFTVTNSFGCISEPTGNVVINARPGPPDLVINNPDTICSNQTANLTDPEITEGSDEGLTFTYWLDAEGTDPLENPEAAPPGVYYIKGTTTAGYFTIKQVIVAADQMPEAYAGGDVEMDYIFELQLDADLPVVGTGMWSVTKGSGSFSDENDPKTFVSDLAVNENILAWTVTNGVCPPAVDYVTITINDLVVPTLITPNGDPYNEYFILRGLEETLGKTELVIFDRRGLQVFHDENYRNDWNGLDDNGKELPDDTYFWIIKASNGKSLSGYIVIRR